MLAAKITSNYELGEIAAEQLAALLREHTRLKRSSRKDGTKLGLCIPCAQS
jgi:hypothetical protein